MTTVPESVAPVATAPPLEGTIGELVFIVVNPSSGGNKASELMRLADKATVVDKPGMKATIYTYAITDPEKEGFKHVKRTVDQIISSGSQSLVRVIAAGGDGTVMWAICELMKHEVDMEHVVIGVVPFGTGNDFSRVTRWGGTNPRTILGKDLSGLHKLLKNWLAAEVKDFDLWEVSIRTVPTADGGRFEFVHDGKKSCTPKDIKQKEIKDFGDQGLEMTKPMCNYFSFGLESRIGLGFDKKRTHSQVLNKLVYIWEGAKKSLWSKVAFVPSFVESMRHVNQPAAHQDEVHNCPKDKTEVIFVADEDSKENGVPLLKGTPLNMLFLNINSMSGGLDLWSWSKKKVASTGESAKQYLSRQMDFGDGHIDVLAYRSAVGFALEQLRVWPFHGNGYRAYSGTGPLRIDFRPPNDPRFIKGTKRCKGRVYMQIDGEYFVVHNPKSVAMRWLNAVKVLSNVGDPVNCCGC